MKNKNFKISDDTHARLKSLSASRRETIGHTIGHLLNQNDKLALGELGRRLERGTIDAKQSTIQILKELLNLREENA